MLKLRTDGRFSMFDRTIKHLNVSLTGPALLSVGVLVVVRVLREAP